MRLNLSQVSLPTFALALALFTQVSAQENLPEGPGKAALQESCTSCHDLGTVMAKKRTPGEWADVLDRMAGFGMSLSDAKTKEIQDYLNANLSSAPAGTSPQSSGAVDTDEKKP